MADLKPPFPPKAPDPRERDGETRKRPRQRPVYGWQRHLYAPYGWLQSLSEMLPSSVGAFNVPWRGIIVFAVGTALIFVVNAMRYSDRLHLRVAGTNSTVLEMQLNQVWTTFGAGLGGAVAGFAAILVFYLINRFRDVALALLALFVLYVSLIPYTGAAASYFTTPVGFIVGAVVAWIVLFGISKLRKPTTLGSAEWADIDHIENNGLTKPTGFYLGYFPRTPKRRGETPPPAVLRYSGKRHLLTVAPTRAGKGVSSIVPNILTYPGSIFVIDPKGENADISLPARYKISPYYYVVDPWGLVGRAKAARFNPLDWLDASDVDINENAMIIADSLVVKSDGGKNLFWEEEAKALLMGLILYVATDRDEQDTRHLGRVRDLLMLDGQELKNLFMRMSFSDNPIVASSGARALQKEAELLSNVLATTQAQTHFLDSPRIRESLSASDFRFEDLKDRTVSIYLVLPADRLETFGRWLRLLVQQAITVNARRPNVQPAHPVLFMLDEMAALGKLDSVQSAYGLMSGFGMQLWGIVQDLSQLERIYGKGWQTFVANSGVIQYFGSRDQMSAEYFSKLCGVTTVMTISSSFSRAISSATGGGSTTTSSSSYGESARNLALPDELMTLPREKQLILVENLNPILGTKIVWHTDPFFEGLGVNLEARQAPEARKSRQRAGGGVSPPSA